jgi:hypothetical protein
MNSLFLGVFAVYLFVALFMLAVGPLLMLVERRRRRADAGTPGADHGA